MHSVCLGVVRRLVQSYLTTSHGLLPCRLSESCRNQLNIRTVSFKGTLPREFRRGIRSFAYHHHFKATEYRTVLLYTGPVLFKGILADVYYKHFMLLHFAITVYMSPSYVSFYDNAKACIEKFLVELKDLFTMSACTYNSHCLLHLYDFVKLLGPLDSFSAFPFENFLRILKRRIKSGRFVMTQSVNSLQTIRQMTKPSSRPLYFSDKHLRDQCALVSYKGCNVPILIDNVSLSGRDCQVSGVLLRIVRDLYEHPYPSRSLGIGIYRVGHIRLDNIQPVSKCVIFPSADDFIVFPYVCSESEQ